MHPALEAFRASPPGNPQAAFSLMQCIDQLSPEDSTCALLDIIDTLSTVEASNETSILSICVYKLLRRRITLDDSAVERLTLAATARNHNYPYLQIFIAAAGTQVTPSLREALARLRAIFEDWLPHVFAVELLQRLDALILTKSATSRFGILPGGPWSAAVFESPLFNETWEKLFHHSTKLTQSSPARKWQTETLAILRELDPAEFRAQATAWLAIGPTAEFTLRTVPEQEAEFQKGLVWAIATSGDTTLCPALADFALACFRKISGLGAVSQKIGNACVNALATMPGLDPVAQLSRLATKVKYDVGRRLIEKALTDAAARNNVSREDLEAMSVPSGEDLSPKDLKALLSAQRSRLERLLSSPNTIAFNQWREWYIDHPLTSQFAHNLIWQFDNQTAIWHNGQLIDWANQLVSTTEATRVKLWHPIEADVQTILSWRAWLEDHKIVQPFKQAHREVYILTDAERTTNTFSNRFAAHLVRQHQFAALCRERGWNFKLMGQWDSHNNPTLKIPAHNLQAELAVDFPPNEAEATASAIYLLISTGSLHFLNSDRQVQPLETIPQRIFTEVLRDVDLFISVTSIASDPNWPNQNHTHLDYWQRHGFGDLSTAAENRKTILATLLPKLAIARHCHIEGNFLHVRGKLHEYRIHLGSGNSIIHDLNRYLCIVQGPSDKAAKLTLPFEGDTVLSLILSKAIMLVADDKIKDESIRRQLS